jgi:uncharacterized protein
LKERGINAPLLLFIGSINVILNIEKIFLKVVAGVEGYLDIETTGLDPYLNEITVVGVYTVDGQTERLVQLVGHNIREETILESVRGIDTLYTYNGKKFDLPFIKVKYLVDLENSMNHCDLVFDCWKSRLYGGLKKVEQYLGIERKLKGINGLEAIRLWNDYVNNNDSCALDTLLAYNKEDVVNLKILREKLLFPPHD